MSRMNQFIAAVPIFFVASVVGAAARLTLPELALRNAPNPVLIERMREFLPEPFERIVAEADLVLHGTVTPLRTYLSDDQYELYSDYLVAPVRVIFQRALEGSRTPGNSQPLIITRWGGTIVINGVQVTLTDRDAPSFNKDTEFVLCLVLDASKGKYRLASDVSGTFSLKNGVVEPLIRDASYDRFKGMTVDRLAAEVRRLKQ